MKKELLLGIFLSGLVTACTVTGSDPASKSKSPAPDARFVWFDYSGDDDAFKTPLANDEFRNPILAGYYPDPSLVRVGEDYYLVNSTFSFFPGIPVFHSRDLVNWTQIGNAIDRPEQLNFDNLSLDYHGVYAATIEYREGIFYIINTCVACGGNFIITATNPAGPWSNPIWLPHLDGIDPSIFFDEDGKTYLVHHKNPKNKRYPAHTAVWVMEVDAKTFAPVSEDVMLIDGGDEAPWHTEYLEGPHIYKIKGTYYLSTAGGGTGYYHGQLMYKSDNIFGPYSANPANPILTQFGLPDDRTNPVTATGHADIFNDSHGDWWIVFLGTRVYDLTQPPQDPGNFQTGRETFMLPMTWKNGWPVVLEKGEAVPYNVKKPQLPASKIASRAMTGNYSVHEDFTGKELGPEWQFVRTPRSKWWSMNQGGLIIQPRPERMGDSKQPSFIGRRLAHMKASFGTKMYFSPSSSHQEAGLMTLQNDDYFYAFGLSQNVDGKAVLKVRLRAGKDKPTRGEIIAASSIALKPNAPVYLRMDFNKANLTFAYSLDGEHYQPILENADAKVVSSAKAGGFAGALIGVYAEGDAKN